MISKVLGDIAVMDCAALYEHFGRTVSMQTIRARCTVVAVDEATGVQLYDFAAAEPILAGVKPRRPHRRRRKSDPA